MDGETIKFCLKEARKHAVLGLLATPIIGGYGFWLLKESWGDVDTMVFAAITLAVGLSSSPSLGIISGLLAFKVRKQVDFEHLCLIYLFSAISVFYLIAFLLFLFVSFQFLINLIILISVLALTVYLFRKRRGYK